MHHIKDKDRKRRFLEVAYVIVREDLCSPVIQTQVISVLRETAGHHYIKLWLLWFCRLDYFFKERKSYASIMEELNQVNIKLLKLPIVVLKFPVNLFFLPILLIQVIIGIFFAKIILGIDLFHARAYYPGLALALIKKIFPEFKFIFDPRSPYTNELVTTYKYSKDSFMVKAWILFENFIVKNANFNIGISKPFCRYLAKNGANVIFIPNNANFSSQSNRNVKDNNYRNSICYIGSLGYGWNNAIIYAHFVKEILFLRDDIFFEFYVYSNSSKIIRKEMENLNINPKFYFIETLPTEHVISRLQGAIAGLQLMDKPDIRLGIKVVEYLAAGLPIITTSEAIGAADIVKKYGVGICIKNNYEEINNFIDFQINNRIYMQKKCFKVAKTVFSTSKVAKKYIRIYKSFL